MTGALDIVVAVVTLVALGTLFFVFRRRRKRPSAKRAHDRDTYPMW